MLGGDLGGGVRWAFTDRHGGVSGEPWTGLNLGSHVGDDPAAVAENRRRLGVELAVRSGGRPEAGGVPLAFMNQVHGAEVAVVADPDRLPALHVPAPDADALVTALPQVGLAVLVADCVPVLMADPEAGVLAAVHAGRPGVRAGVVPRALEEMLALGARPERVHALLGPSICGRCYEVPEAMRDDVATVAPAAACTTRAGTPGLDLRVGLVAVLAALGVAARCVGECTAESPDLYSYRRDGVTGRLAGVLWRTA